MLKSEISVVLALIPAPQQATKLARALDLSASRMSELIRGLIAKKLLMRDAGKITLAKTPRTAILVELAEKLNIFKLLEGANEQVLVCLEQPKTLAQIKTATNLSSPQVYKSLSHLREIGAVKKTGNLYKISNELVSRYAQLSNEEILMGDPIRKVLFLRKIKNITHTIFKVAQGSPVEGTPTAFSKFSEFGIDYYSKSDYYCAPEKKLTANEVLAHALLAAEDKKQMSICGIFYLKNKQYLDAKELERLAKYYGVLDRWLDFMAYIDCRPVNDGRLFLDWQEFKNKAKIYGIKITDKFPGSKLLSELYLVGEKTTAEIDIYMIGGGNFILRGLKDSTKDLDIITKNKNDFDTLVGALKKCGYEELLPIDAAYKKIFAGTIMDLAGRPRWDIFIKTVCKALQLDKHMLSRATFYKRFGNLNLHLIAFEDIFLFKSITDRDGDLEDAALIAAKLPLRWKLILDELKEQEKITKKHFCIDVLDTLEVLRLHYNIKTPIETLLKSYCLQHIMLILLGSGPKDIKQLKSAIDFPEYQLYNALLALCKSGKIKTLRNAKRNRYALA